MLLLCGLAIAFSGYAELERFADRDLTKLGEEGKAVLGRLCRRLDGKDGEDPWLRTPEPIWIKRYRSGSMRWLFLRVYPGYDVPDYGFARACGFDEKWNLVARHEFPTGYRLRFVESSLNQNVGFAQPVVSIKVESVGPFIEVNGQKVVPAFAPTSGVVQYYAFDEKRAYLVRIQDGAGDILANGYTAEAPDIGPSPAGRTVEEWTKDLNSSDPVRQTHVMVWLAGRHLGSEERRYDSVSQESVMDSKTFEAARSDPEVVDRVRSLARTAKPWVQKQAAFTRMRLEGVR